MNRSFLIPRGYIKFLQFLGTFFSALILIMTIFVMSSDQLGVYLQNDNNRVLWAIIIGVEVYMLWKSIYSAFVIIRYMNKSTDEEILANRFIMSVLSMGVGGFVTPFILTSLPKQQSESTINPRAFLAKYLGFTMLVGFILFIGVLLIFTTTQGMNVSNVIETKAGLLALGIAIIGILIGFLGVALFSSKNAQTNMEEKNSLGFVMQVVGVIFSIIATVEMILIAVMAIMRLIAVIADSLRFVANSDGIMKMFAIMILFSNLAFQAMYVSMIMKICGSIIQGLWTKEQVITIKQFQDVEQKEAEQKNKMNSF